MTETIKAVTEQCLDPTQSLTIELPCQLFERVERYAQETGQPVAGILIEALDAFMRKPGR